MKNVLLMQVSDMRSSYWEEGFVAVGCAACAGGCAIQVEGNGHSDCFATGEGGGRMARGRRKV